VGTLAELVLVSVRCVATKPAVLGWLEADALPSRRARGLSMHHEVLGLTSGDTLLVHAASGGAGSFAVQLGVHAGARVIGSASPGNHDYLRVSVPSRWRLGIDSRCHASIARVRWPVGGRHRCAVCGSRNWADATCSSGPKGTAGRARASFPVRELSGSPSAQPFPWSARPMPSIWWKRGHTRGKVIIRPKDPVY
jgi:hypothetical protein